MERLRCFWLIVSLSSLVSQLAHAQMNSEESAQTNTEDLQGRGDEQRASTVVDEGSCNKSCIILVSSGSLAVVIMCLALMLYYAVCKDKDKGFAEQSMKWNEIRNQQQQEKQQQKQLGEERQQQKKITPYMNNPYAPSTVGTTVTNISTTQRQYAPQTNINANYHMQDQGMSPHDSIPGSYNGPYIIDNFGDTYLTASPYSGSYNPSYLESGSEFVDSRPPHDEYERRRFRSISPLSPSSPLDGMYDGFNYPNIFHQNQGSLKSNVSASSNNTSSGGSSNKKKMLVNNYANNMRTIKEAAEHLKVPTCGGNVGVMQKKRSNLKKNHRATPDPFDGPMINTRTKQNAKISNNTNNNNNNNKAKPYPQLSHQQHQLQHQQPIYYDPRYSSSGQYWQPYSDENVYVYNNTPYDCSTMPPEEYWLPSQNYLSEYQPSYLDYQRQITNSTDNSAEYRQPTTEFTAENQRRLNPDFSDYQRQQPSGDDNNDNNDYSTIKYHRESKLDYRKQNIDQVEYYEDEGYVERITESPQSNTIERVDDEEQRHDNGCHDDLKQYVC